MRELMVVVGMLAMAVGCGGSDKKQAEGPEPFSFEDDPDAVEYEDVDDTIVEPEKFEQIDLALERKAPRVSRCYADAIESGAIDRNVKGTVVVGLEIARDGSPLNVRILPASSLKQPAITDCVVAEIERIKFTTLPKKMPYSYTYKLERDY